LGEGTELEQRVQAAPSEKGQPASVLSFVLVLAAVLWILAHWH
jgi:hypothetical protein